MVARANVNQNQNLLALQLNRAVRSTPHEVVYKT